MALDGAVSLGHERAVRLGLDVQLAPEMAERDGVGGVAEAEGQIEPTANLRGWVRWPERVLAHRVLAHPCGRYRMAKFPGR
jgi:hypothetical protein